MIPADCGRTSSGLLALRGQEAEVDPVHEPREARAVRRKRVDAVIDDQSDPISGLRPLEAVHMRRSERTEPGDRPMRTCLNLRSDVRLAWDPLTRFVYSRHGPYREWQSTRLPKRAASRACRGDQE